MNEQIETFAKRCEEAHMPETQRNARMQITMSFVSTTQRCRWAPQQFCKDLKLFQLQKVY